jgi:hypothetical protein
VGEEGHVREGEGSEREGPRGPRGGERRGSKITSQIRGTQLERRGQHKGFGLVLLGTCSYSGDGKACIWLMEAGGNEQCLMLRLSAAMAAPWMSQACMKHV